MASHEAALELGPLLVRHRARVTPAAGTLKSCSSTASSVAVHAVVYALPPSSLLLSPGLARAALSPQHHVPDRGLRIDTKQDLGRVRSGRSSRTCAV